MVRGFVLLVILPWLSGCMAMASMDHKCYYPGVRTNIKMIAESPALLPFGIIDLPFSAILDTIMVPATSDGGRYCNI